MIYLPRPKNCDAESLHAQIAALGFGSCCIEWRDDELGFRFDYDLGGLDFEALQNTVLAHDGSSVIAARAAQEAAIAVIRAVAEPLAANAREKRLAGEALTSEELAALVDVALFGT
jgi:hypothetical protein